MSVPIAIGAVVAIIAICHVLSLPLAVSAVAAMVAFPLVLFLNRTSAPAVSTAVAAVTDLFDDEKEKKRLERKKRKEAAAKESAAAAAESAQQKSAEAKRRKAEKKAQTANANATAQPQPQPVQPQPPVPTVSHTAAAVTADASGDDDDIKSMTKTAAKKAKKEAKRIAEENAKAAAASSPAVVPAPSSAASASTSAASAPSQKETKTAKKAAAVVASSAEVLPATVDAADDEGGWKTISSAPVKTASTKGAAGKSTQSANDTTTAAATTAAEKYEELFVPFKFHGTIIGVKGATLQQLQTATGAKIDMPKKESGSTKVQLSGSADAVAACKGAIESLIKHNYSTITHPGYVHDDMHVDDDKIGAVIGPKGAYRNAIQEATRTRITVPDKESTSSRIDIVGLKENVRAAKLAIKELIAEGFSSITHPDHIRRVISFPSDKISRMIGVKGQTIKSIQGNTSTRIKLPQTSSTSASTPVDVVIWGTATGVAQAEKEIQRLLIPAVEVMEEPEEQYVNGTWGGAANTEDDLWE